MDIFKRLLLTFAILPFSGCATVDRSAVSAALHGKSVAVASVVGSNINLAWAGTTVFNNEYKRIPTADGAIDKEIEQTVVDVLRATNRYSRVSTVGDATADLSKLPALVKADYLITVEPGTSADTQYGTNQRYIGLGLFQRSALGSKPSAIGHVSLRVKLIRVPSGEEVSIAEESNVWPSDIVLSTFSNIPPEDLAGLQKKLTFRATGVVASALEKLGAR